MLNAQLLVSEKVKFESVLLLKYCANNLSILSFNFSIYKVKIIIKLKVKILVTQPCVTLCKHMDCSLPGSSVHGIIQARILEWVAMPCPGDHPDPGIEPVFPLFPALAGRFFATSAKQVLQHQVHLNSGFRTYFLGEFRNTD